MLSFLILRTQLSVCFLSPFLDSLPQLFLKCLPFALAFGLFPFLPLSFVCFRSGSGYSAFCFFLSSSSLLRHSAAFQVLPLCLSTSLLFHFRSTRFPVLPFRFFVLGFLFVSFHPSQFRSHSCSTGASLLLSPSGFSLPILLSFVRFCSGSDYSASVSSFPLSSRFPLTVVSSVLLFCFRFLGFPRSFRPSFPCLLSRFFVLSFLHFLSPSLSRLTVATSAPLPSSFRLPASFPLLSL